MDFTRVVGELQRVRTELKIPDKKRVFFCRAKVGLHEFLIRGDFSRVYRPKIAKRRKRSCTIRCEHTNILIYRGRKTNAQPALCNRSGEASPQQTNNGFWSFGDLFVEFFLGEDKSAKCLFCFVGNFWNVKICEGVENLV
jgi:hypothetical protein